MPSKELEKMIKTDSNSLASIATEYTKYNDIRSDSDIKKRNIFIQNITTTNLHLDKYRI